MVKLCFHLIEVEIEIRLIFLRVFTCFDCLFIVVRVVVIYFFFIMNDHCPLLMDYHGSCCILFEFLLLFTYIHTIKLILLLFFILNDSPSCIDHLNQWLIWILLHLNFVIVEVSLILINVTFEIFYVFVVKRLLEICCKLFPMFLDLLKCLIYNFFECLLSPWNVLLNEFVLENGFCCWSLYRING